MDLFANYALSVETDKKGIWKQFLNHKQGATKETYAQILQPREEVHSVQLLNHFSSLSLQQQVQLKLFEKAVEDNEPER